MRYTLRGQKNSAASQPQLSFKAVNNKASQYLSSTSLARGAQPVVKALTRHLRLPIMTLSALGAAMMVSPAAAQSSLPTFDCVNEAYNVFGAPSQLQRFDPASRTVLSSIPINPGLGVNAIGFNPQDNYLYGRINNTNGIAGFTAGEFIRIGEDGSVESLGVPSPATPGEAPFTANNASGTMDAAGNWYGISGSDVFIVNIGNNPAAGSLTYTSVARSASTIIPFDLAFSAFDGAIYGMSGGLVRIDPVTGFGSIVTTTGDPLAGSGGAWSTADGTLFFYSNSSGTLRSVDVSQPTPVVTIVGSVPSNSSFDSAACLPPSLAKGILGAPDADGRFSYEFTISNAFPNSISVNFNDVLPPELDFVPGSLSPAAPGGATVTTFDNDTLRLSNMSLGALSNLTFSAQVELVPGVAAGTPVSNQATLEFGATTLNSTDPDGGGSGAPTTFAVAAAPSLILDKPAPVNADEDGSGTVTVGDTLTYTITATNDGNTPLNNVVITDPLFTAPADTTTCATLAIGATCVLTGSHVVTAAQATSGSVDNSANVVSDEVTSPVTATQSTAVGIAEADLAITKTNTPGVNGEVDQASDTVREGSMTTYTLVVTNNGPAAVTGARISDTPGTGLVCSGTDTVALSGDGVPAGSFTIADLTGAGITLDTLGNGQSTTLTYSCEVN